MKQSCKTMYINLSHLFLFQKEYEGGSKHSDFIDGPSEQSQQHDKCLPA
jgi:hypothetical protein